MSDREQKRRRVLAVLLSRAEHERVDELQAHAHLYPPARSVERNPLFSPPAAIDARALNKKRAPTIGLPAGGRADELTFDDAHRTG